MSKIIFILFLTFIKIKNTLDMIKDIKISNDNKIVQPGISETILINYQENYFYEFNIIEGSDLQINIRPINCNIDVYYKENLVDPINLNIYSFTITKDDNTISLIPIRDIVDGKYKENYEVKECPIAINSYYIEDKRELEIKNKEGNVLYLNDSIDSLNISYDITSITINSFVSLYFNFKESQFLIDIFYTNSNNQRNSLLKYINESTYIYLNSEFLKSNDNDNINGKLTITIQNKDKKNTYIYLKIIEENTVCLLEENALNFGFIT